MPRVGPLLAALSFLLCSCGQVEPVMVGARMPDCAQVGASSMHPGEARVVLGLDGLADVGLYLVRLQGGTEHRDLEEHIERSDRLPSWSDVELELRIDDAQGVRGLEQTISLGQGRYAVVCADHAYGSQPALTVAGPLTVEG